MACYRQFCYCETQSSSPDPSSPSVLPSPSSAIVTSTGDQDGDGRSWKTETLIVAPTTTCGKVRKQQPKQFQLLVRIQLWRLRQAAIFPPSLVPSCVGSAAKGKASQSAPNPGSSASRQLLARPLWPCCILTQTGPTRLRLQSRGPGLRKKDPRDNLRKFLKIYKGRLQSVASSCKPSLIEVGREGILWSYKLSHVKSQICVQTMNWCYTPEKGPQK